MALPPTSASTVFSYACAGLLTLGTLGLNKEEKDEPNPDRRRVFVRMLGSLSRFALGGRAPYRTSPSPQLTLCGFLLFSSPPASLGLSGVTACSLSQCARVRSAQQRTRLMTLLSRCVDQYAVLARGSDTAVCMAAHGDWRRSKFCKV